MIIVNLIWNIIDNLFGLFSLDNLTGTGDHENFFVTSKIDIDIVNESVTKIYSNCKKIAVRTRTVGEHQLWPNIPGAKILFSELTDRGFQYYTDKN